MKRLVFLVEGDPEELKNFSGIPHFFTRALGESLEAVGLGLEVVDTSYLFNVEELLLCLQRTREGRGSDELLAEAAPSARRRKLLFPLNEELLAEARRLDGVGLCAALRRYYARVAEHVRGRLAEILQPGDVLLSQNHFYPFTGGAVSVNYYLDTSLVDFYFDGKLGTVPAARRPAGVEDLYRELECEVLGGAPRVFCFSEALRLDLHRRHRVALDSLSVAYAGVNLGVFPEPVEREPREFFRLLFVGLDFVRKGGNVLLAAMERLHGLPVQLTCVTREGEMPAGDLPRNVIVLPPCDKERLDELYRAADAFVFPTRFEPFGIVLCEAMAYSLPVIASNVFAVPEILGGGALPLLVEPSDADGLAAAVRRLLERPELRTVAGRHNYMRACRLFRWRTVADRIIEQCLADSMDGSRPASL